MTAPSAVTESEESVGLVCRGTNDHQGADIGGKYVARANIEPCFHQSETRLQEEFWITGGIN